MAVGAGNNLPGCDIVRVLPGAAEDSDDVVGGGQVHQEVEGWEQRPQQRSARLLVQGSLQ